MAKSRTKSPFTGRWRIVSTEKYAFLHLCLEPPDDVEATEIVDLNGTGGPVVRDKERVAGPGNRRPGLKMTRLTKGLQNVPLRLRPS